MLSQYLFLCGNKMSHFNFKELIANGKEIDKTIAVLNAKLLEPTKLGNGREAREALKDIKKEITEINNTCRYEINSRNDEYESVLNCSKMVNDYVDRIDEVLDKLESEVTQYGYETYQSHCSRNEKNFKNGNDYLNVSGVQNLSLCDPRLTPVITCQGGNRKLQFNDTLSSSWSTASPIRPTPRVFVDNSFLSSTVLKPWQHKKNSTVTNTSRLPRFNR